MHFFPIFSPLWDFTEGFYKIEIMPFIDSYKLSYVFDTKVNIFSIYIFLKILKYYDLYVLKNYIKNIELFCLLALLFHVF